MNTEVQKPKSGVVRVVVDNLPAIPFPLEIMLQHHRVPGQRWGQAFFNSLPDEFLKEHNLTTEGHPNKAFIDSVYNERDEQKAKNAIATSYLLANE